MEEFIYEFLHNFEVNVEIPLYRDVSEFKRRAGRLGLIRVENPEQKGLYELFLKEEGEAKALGRIIILRIWNSGKIIAYGTNSETININNTVISIGFDIDYYKNIEKYYKQDYVYFLQGARDIFFTFSEEKAEKILFSNIKKDKQYHISFRRIKDIFYSSGDIDKTENQKIYDIEIPIGNNKRHVFKFNKDAIGINRMIALIGKNGSGKTKILHMISFMVNSKNFNYNFIVSISYNIFDNYRYPDHHYRFKPCGTLEDRSINKLFDSVVINIRNIYYKDRVGIFSGVMATIFNEEDYLHWHADTEIEDIVDNLSRIREWCSGGQFYIIALMSELLSSIVSRSLLLIDELENMTHPQVLVNIIKAINIILEEFDCMSIISTHSPFVVQNMLSENVFIVERPLDRISLRNPRIQTLGASIEELIQEIFYTDLDKQVYVDIIRDLIASKGKDFVRKSIYRPNSSLLTLLDVLEESSENTKDS